MSSDLSGRTILFLVTEDWYFVSHRLPVARAARDAGMRVHVACRVGRDGGAIRDEGFELHPLRWRRGRGGLASSLRALLEIRALLRRLRPDIMHAVALKAVVFGALAVLPLSVRPVFAIAGLGFAFTQRSPAAAALRLAMRAVFRFAVDRRDAVILLQNDDDLAVLRDRGFVRRARMQTIRGSGVDAVHFAPLPEPGSTVPTVAVVSRMIAIKGIADLVAASRLLHSAGVTHRLLLVGDPDAENPSAISPAILREWAQAPWIEWLGGRSDVRGIWEEADIAALTSLGGEGLPKTLLEAAACGRPLVATDVPGSRDIVVDGETGYLAPPGDPGAIAAALLRLLEDSEARRRFGGAARARVEASFSQERIADETLNLYADLIRQMSPRALASA